MQESIGTYMHAVNQMGDAAGDVQLLLMVSLVCQLVFAGYVGYSIYRVWREWR